MSTTLKACELLEATKKLFDGGKNWRRGHYARDVNGYGIEVTDPTATTFCLLGGFLHAAGDLVDTEYRFSPHRWQPGPARTAYEHLAKAIAATDAAWVNEYYDDPADAHSDLMYGPEGWNDDHASGYNAVETALNVAINNCIAAAKEQAA